MSKLTVLSLSVLILLCAHLPSGLAGPALAKKQHHSGESRRVYAATLEARQLEGLTSLAGAATSDWGAFTSLAGVATSDGGAFTSDMAAYTSVGKGFTSDLGDMTALAGGGTSVGGEFTSTMGGVASGVGSIFGVGTAAPVSSAVVAPRELDVRQEIVSSFVKGVTTVAGRATSALATETAVSSVVAGVTRSVEGVTSIVPTATPTLPVKL
ncbi:hypothetical protein EDD18DRAFT_1105333 [Armillaria luteobubalina]|uniref:Uncharacterized protein n=1 Tax=Armillaria luteobubalina TaxID=153913 RepID=A0AA39Q8C3_9AGAR|nr:hypothetical protein EDD18DRAFT_1105333 [Armillaria luteobubalina]